MRAPAAGGHCRSILFEPLICSARGRDDIPPLWFAVGRTEQLPARGDVLQVEVAGESVIVIRGRDDALAAFYNVCRHRGSQLVREQPLPDAARPAARNSGRAGAAIVCPYHAWSYNLDGSLRAAPFVQFDAACRKEKFSLVPVALETWGGFIFPIFRRTIRRRSKNSSSR